MTLITALLFLIIGVYLGTLIDTSKIVKPKFKNPLVKKETGAILRPPLNPRQLEKQRLIELEEEIERNANSGK